MSLSVKEILNIGRRHLEESGVADAAIDCKLLYCYLMNVTTAQLILEYQKMLPESLCDEYFKLLEQRGSGIPLQYITGSQEFMGLDFMVNDKVLIPRQDTETLVEDAMGLIQENSLRGERLLQKAKKDWDILDLCCGSGAIGLSLAKLCQNVKVWCSDLSEDALSVAKENAARLGLSKITFQQGSLLEPFQKRFRHRKFDLIISNPPYIKSSVIETLQREVRDHEPMMALDGGESGLDFYREIISGAADCLKKEGVIMFEIGHDQKGDVCGLLEETGRFVNITALQDLAGRDRIVAAVLKGKKQQD